MSLSVRDKLDLRALYLVIFTALAFGHVLLGQTTQYDLVITGGKIVDGSGGSWYYGDVAIQGDTIVAMGKLGPAAGVRRLDAHGCGRPWIH
jgi:adenine deaminase